MNKIVLRVPQGTQFMSEWNNYDFPKGHVIVDKGVTGCGYTEYCLTNNLPIVLCSPRKLLLENKSEQHQGDKNILYVKNELTEFDDLRYLKNKVKSFIESCFNDLNEPPKLLVTYDSSHYIKEALKELGLLSHFYFIVDEFQSIFLDSFYKSNVEFDFVENLEDCPNVLYLSATPMLDKYLEKVEEFKDLPFYSIDWSDTGYVENIVLQRKQTRSLFEECKKIIEKYKEGKYPMTITKDKKPAFYFDTIQEVFDKVSFSILLLDEVQFMLENDIMKLTDLKQDVIAYGLKSDINAKLFPASAKLLAIADSVKEIPALCENKGCNNKAQVHSRYINNKLDKSGISTMIENGLITYKSLCINCWKKERE